MARTWKMIAAPALVAVALSGCNKQNNAAAPGSQPPASTGNTANAPVQPAPANNNPNYPNSGYAGGQPAGPQYPAQSAERRNERPNERRDDRERAERRNEQGPVPNAPAALTVPAGTEVTVRTTQTLAASRNEPGDTFTGVLESPVVVHGTEVFRRGTEVRGTVVASKGRGRFKGSGDLGVELTSIGGYRVQTSEYEREAKGRGRRSTEMIGGGGGVGALIGGLAGGGKGALIGGLAGAGAGTAASAYTGNRDVVIPSEATISFTVESPITLH